MPNKYKSVFLIAIAIIIHIFFYVSAAKLHFLEYFFPWGNVHEFQGIDFFQVPNGAYMFAKGGSLTGASTLTQQTYAYGNYNVFHPFFTILAGGFFIHFPPHEAFLIMMLIKILLTIFSLYFLYKRFRNNKYLPLAFFIFLTFFPQYLEIWNGQYHFFLEISALFLIYYLTMKEKKHTLLKGILLFINLLVKPIGLLWIPILLIRKNWKVVFLGFSLTLAATIPFLVNHSGDYFINNLIERLRNPIGGPPGVFTIDAILRFYHFNFYNGFFVKTSIFLLIFFMAIRYRFSLFFSIFVTTSFYLLFYDLVFEYHYVILIPFFVLGVLSQPDFRKRVMIGLMLSYSFPTPFFLFYYFQIFAKGQHIEDTGWTIIVLFRVLPLIAINVYLLFSRFGGVGKIFRSTVLLTKMLFNKITHL